MVNTFGTKIRTFTWKLKQFIKITEYAREGKLHPSTISKAQLQEVIIEIHTKMEDYEYIALTEDEKIFFLADKNYFHSCQKTIYHTISESTQPINEIVTTTSYECLMLTRPSMNILQQCDVKINSENSVFWKHIPSLKAWIF